MGGTSSLELSREARIDVQTTADGIFAEGAGQHIFNHGHIRGNNEGIHGEIWGNLENHGTIEGIVGVSYLGPGSQIVNHGEISGFAGISVAAGGTSIRNEKGGIVTGDEVAVAVNGVGSAEIVNKGTIRSDTWAVYAEVGNVYLTNRGKIVGDVRLTSAADLFDTTNGEVRGIVDGRGGDDIYHVSSSGIRIDDSGSSTDDQVYSFASYVLSAGLENIALLGNRNLNATGNAADNSIAGNEGDNRLVGGDGADAIRGAGGNDRLFGGSGADDFYLLKKEAVDVVEDFEDGIDHLLSDRVGNQADLDALRIRMAGDDTIIDFGGGDRLILLDIDKDQLSYIDFR